MNTIYTLKLLTWLEPNSQTLLLFQVLESFSEHRKTRSEAYKKGYVGGHPDILIVNPNKQYNGFAIELKTPKGTGSISDKQIDYLATLNDCK